MASAIIERIHALFNDKSLRKRFLKLRLPLFLVLFALLLTQLEPGWFFPGLVVSVLGELLQLWCFATIKTQKRLTTEGPYMFMRNPMYIGRFFLILGILLMTGNPWLIGGYVIIYYFYMVNRVRREEKVLRELFGQDYGAYCREVPPYRPTLKRLAPGKLFLFDNESFRQNHGVRNMVAVGACYVVLFIFTYVYPVG
ncbi:MAG: methyltransferase family protein [Thermodesulfobacteriota bacterium]